MQHEAVSLWANHPDTVLNHQARQTRFEKRLIGLENAGNWLPKKPSLIVPYRRDCNANYVLAAVLR